MKRNRLRNARTSILRLILTVALTLAAAVLLCWALGWFENEEPSNIQVDLDYTQRRQLSSTVMVDDVRYLQKTGVTTILLMGIDKNLGDNLDSGYRDGGQADFLRLIVINSIDKTVSTIALDRDTMTTIATIGVLGNRTGTRTAQLALSHSFGDGGEMSAQLTVEAVEKLLLGMHIDYYVAMNMDGIVMLNDMVGGIELTFDEDLTAVDEAFTEGSTVLLTGEQAEAYIRARMGVGSGTNYERMGRQQVYWDKLYSRMIECVNGDSSFMENLLTAMDKYLVTNMARGRIVNEAGNVADYTVLPTQSIEGERKVGADNLMQFWMSEESIKSIILSTIFEVA